MKLTLLYQESWAYYKVTPTCIFVWINVPNNCVVPDNCLQLLCTGGIDKERNGVK